MELCDGSAVGAGEGADVVGAIVATVGLKVGYGVVGSWVGTRLTVGSAPMESAVGDSDGMSSPLR